MSIDETIRKIDGIAKEMSKRNMCAKTFYFTEIGEDRSISSHTFRNSDEVSSYLHNMSLTHGIFTICQYNDDSISAVLKPLKDYSIPEIDANVVEKIISFLSQYT